MKANYYIQRLIAMLLSLVMVLTFLGYYPVTIIAKAESEATCVTPGIYYIHFRNSNKVLDVTDESIQPGIQLQIWKKYDDHANQKFQLEKCGTTWRIRALNSYKVVSVKSRSQNDYAHISQETEAHSNVNYQRWYIEEDDGYVRFKNANSEMYMTVYNAINDASNGSKLVQRKYQNGENRVEQQFTLEKIKESSKIKCAYWQRKITVNDIYWEERTDRGPLWNTISYKNYDFINTYNFPIPQSKQTVEFGETVTKFYTPYADQPRILYRIEYLDSQTCENLIYNQALIKEDEPKKNSIRDYVLGQYSDATFTNVTNWLVEKAVGKIPILGQYIGDTILIAKGVAEIINSSYEEKNPAHESWNNFVMFHKNNKCGIKRKCYIEFFRNKDGNLEPAITYDIEKWDGHEDFYKYDGTDYYLGEWCYVFGNYATEYTIGSLKIHTGGNANYVTSNLNYTSGIYEISVNSSLNVRSGPGTGYGRIGSLHNGDTVEVSAISNGNWGKIDYEGETGWICLKYAKYQGDSGGSSGGNTWSWDSSSSGDYCVNVNSHLNVRSSASTRAEIIGKLNNGDIIHVIETVDKNDGSIWAHINYYGMIGYCCMRSTGGDYYLSQRISPSKPYVNATGGTSQSDSYFSWNSCSYANSYDIRIYNSAGSIVNSQMGLTSTSYQTRLPAGNYQVDVASVYSSDSYTFSDRVSFSVSKVIPDKPVVNVSPGNDLSDTCISWNSCRYADCYDVNIYKSNGTSYKTISNTTSTSFKGNLSDIADYYVIVTAKNNTDGTHNSSDRRNFTVVSAVPSKPTLSLIPGNNHTLTTYTWNICENANTYTLDVTNVDTGEKVLSQSMTETNYEMILSVPGNYEAKVTSVYTKGGTTNESDVVKFHVEDVDVKPFSVSVAGVSDTIVSLEWTESLHATQYDIYRYSEGNYSLVGTTSELSYVDTGLYIGTEYKYYVHASNEWTDIKSDNEVSAETILLSLNGSGSEESPYLISSEDDWHTFTDLINDSKTNKMFASSHYKQTVNLNFEDSIPPVGTTDTPFNGYYDGNYCSITGLLINADHDDSGLFGYCRNAYISNLTVHGAINSSQSIVGGIAGRIGVGGTIENCAFYGDVNGINNVGGIVGYIENGGSLIRCYHVGNVNGEISGGIVGKARVGFYTNSTDINIVASYHSGGNVTGAYSGGITGLEECGSIKKCNITYSDCFYLKGTSTNPISGKTNAGILAASDTVFQNLTESLGLPYIDGGVSNNHYPVFKWDADLYIFNGQGTQSSPYLIENADDLIQMSQYVNDNYLNTKYGNAFYLQTSDIDLSNCDFTPIGNEGTPFNGQYNGGYHSITGLNVSGNHSGFFGYVQSTRIENLIIEGNITGDITAGGIVGYSSESVEIMQCAFNGDIHSQISGGLIGQANQLAKISSCYHNGSVAGSIAGGLIGQFDSDGSESPNSLSIVSSYHGTGSVSNGAVGSLLADETAIFAENVYYLKETANASGYAQSVNQTVLKNLSVTLEKPFVHGTINSGYPVFEWQIEKYLFKGDGTSDSPYIIESSDDLIALQRYVNDPSYNSIYGSAYYQQVNDIDLGDREWVSIGINEQCSFKGVYDGNFCTIYGLNAYGDSYSGLFGQVVATSGARNAGIYNLIIKYGSSCSATGVTGGTAAVLTNGATLDHCSVIGDLSGGTGVGGLVGVVKKSASVLNSYHNGNVTGLHYVGGLVGYVESGTLRIENCYHTSGIVYSEYDNGAIIGCSKGASNISNCFYLDGSCDSAVNGSSNPGVLPVNPMVLQNLSITLGDAYIDNFTEYNDGYPIFAAQYDIDTPFVSGDVNADGYFDIDDIKMLQNWLLGSNVLQNWEAGDLYEDGIIDVNDLVMMKRLYVDTVQFVDESYIHGDVNSDGLFNITDVILLQQWLLAIPNIQLANWKAADMCKDDKLDVFDLCLMKRELLNN